MNNSEIINGVNNNTEKKVISGGIFIIPHRLVTGSTSLAKMSEYEIDWYMSVAQELKEIGVSLSFPLIEARAHNEECDNFDRHYWSYEKMVGKGKRFPRYIPYKVLKDLKEGDTLVLETKDVRFELKALQLESRYRAFGSFEVVLKKVMPFGE